MRFIIFVCLHIFVIGSVGEAQPKAAPLSKKQAIRVAQSYLQIKNSKEYKIKVKSELITFESYNTYKKLENGIKRTAWVVVFTVPKAVGSSRVVYVDKKNGEILGGYSSK